MIGATEWEWKLEEVRTRLLTRYEHIGSKTAAPFLAVVYPQDAEPRVLRKWEEISRSLENHLSIRTVDALEVTSAIVRKFGADSLVQMMADAMPGADPAAELGRLWTEAMAQAIAKTFEGLNTARPAVALKRLAALYPVSGPRAVMEALWDSNRSGLKGPVIFFIPGTLLEARRYLFVGKREEIMYRGDIL